MSYGYSNGWGGNNYRSGYSRQGARRSQYRNANSYNTGYSAEEYGPQLPKRPQNGCKVMTARNGNTYITGWCNDKRRGFIKVLVYKVAKSDEVHTSQSGRDWCSVRAKVTFSNGQSQVFNALLDVAANRVKIKDLNYILSPSKDYCGPSFTKR